MAITNSWNPAWLVACWFWGWVSFYYSPRRLLNADIRQLINQLHSLPSTPSLATNSFRAFFEQVTRGRHSLLYKMPLPAYQTCESSMIQGNFWTEPVPAAPLKAIADAGTAFSFQLVFSQWSLSRRSFCLLSGKTKLMYQQLAASAYVRSAILLFAVLLNGCNSWL